MQENSDRFSLISDYWEVFLSFLFKYPSRCYEIDKSAEPLTLKNPSLSLGNVGNSYQSFLGSRGIICRVTDNEKDLKRACQTLVSIYEEITDPKLCDLATSEILAKVVAYRKLNSGNIVAIPTLMPNQEIHLAKYVVDKVFDLWNNIQAFGLIPIENAQLAPILLFRGTDFSLKSEQSRASIISDFDPKGPGRTLFETAQKALRRWLQAVASDGAKARVIGHSLGGAISLYTLIYEHSLISNKPHECSYAFNFPGVNGDVVDEWKKIPEKEKPAFRGFVCRGDIVSKFGQLFGDVSEVSFKTPLSPIRAHEQLFFAEPICYLQKIDVEEENQSSSHQFYSKLQKQTVSIMYECGLKFLLPHEI